MTIAPSPLSPREHEILQLVAGGISIAEIAERLGIREGTIRNHLRFVHAKLGVGKTNAAAAMAMRHGWIE